MVPEMGEAHLIAVASWLALAAAGVALVLTAAISAYLVQTPVILLLGIALRPVAVIPAVLGLAACFSVAAAHRRWTRGRRRSWSRRGKRLGSPSVLPQRPVEDSPAKTDGGGHGRHHPAAEGPG
jgi:hypothetical protein